ncbi:MAG: hypothetical protein ACE15C_20425 [Phycisphaerae bacterium]
MPNINCPLCGAALNLPESAAGKEVACGICKGRFTAPALPAVQPTPGFAPQQGAGAPLMAPPPLPEPYASYPPPIPVQLPTSGFSIASLVLGICSIVTCACYGIPSLVCGILGIVFAGKVKQAVDAGTASESSRGLAKAGLICSIIGIVIGLGYAVVIIAAIAAPHIFRNF